MIRRRGIPIITIILTIAIAILVIFVISIYLLSSQSTDISTKPEFAARLTTYNMDDDDPMVDWNDKGNITDWFSFDFSLEELRSLRVKQVIIFCFLSLFVAAPTGALFWSIK